MIGIASPTFCLTPLVNMLERISMHFKLWEILSEGEDRLELAREGILYGRDSFGMSYQVHAPISDVNIGSAHEPMRLAAMDEVKQTIMMCHQLEIPLVTVHPGFVQGIAFLNRALAVERTKDSLKEIAVFARSNSVRLALENLPANINGTCTNAAEVAEVADSAGVELCFDVGHANTSGQIEEMLALLPRFANIHIHNNDGSWDQHNVIDDGTADMGRIVGRLKQSYKGNIVIEATDLDAGVESKKKLEVLLR